MLLCKSLDFCRYVSAKAYKNEGTYTQTKKNNIFPKKTEKRKKEKESSLKGRDAGRPKGNGISPEGWLVRHEQDIMP